MSAVEPSVVTLPSAGAGELEAPPLSPGQMAWRRFRRHKMAMVSAVIIIFLFIYSFAGIIFYSEADANATDTNLRLQGPAAEHPFGTDTVGRDILARTIYGGQISLFIALTAVTLETGIGILVGAAAGYYGGRVDGILMRITEAI
ncbi:MAG: hypothetical protein KC441_07085, partial [Anaerolineales bacterium]|nr:hypothetical protein [Anaerolineales bacterium]